MRNNSGFSMMELLTVIGILAILAAIAIPGFIGWRTKAQLSRAAQDLYSNFQKAKIEAVRRNVRCAISFNAAGYPNSYVLFADANEDFLVDAGEMIRTVAWSKYPGVDLDTSEGGGDGISFANPADGIAFASDGLARNSLGSLASGSVFLKNQNKRISIDISTAGNIRINALN